jgi:hypothetical protein
LHPLCVHGDFIDPISKGGSELGNSHCFKPGVAAAAIVIALATPNLARAEESPGFFEYLHGAHFAAEMVCKYWYGEDKPAPGEKRIGKKVCHVVLHPVGVLRSYEPEWWKQHEPKVLRGAENLMELLGDAHERVRPNDRVPTFGYTSACRSVIDCHYFPDNSLLLKDYKPLLGLRDSTASGAGALRSPIEREDVAPSAGTLGSQSPGFALREFPNKP